MEQAIQDLLTGIGGRVREERLGLVPGRRQAGEIEGGAPEPVPAGGRWRQGQPAGAEGGDDEPVDVGVGRIVARGRHRIAHRSVGPVVGVAAGSLRGLQGPGGPPGQQNARGKDHPRDAPRSRLQRSAGSRRGGMAAGTHRRDREPKSQAHQARAEFEGGRSGSRRQDHRTRESSVPPCSEDFEKRNLAPTSGVYGFRSGPLGSVFAGNLRISSARQSKAF